MQRFETDLQNVVEFIAANASDKQNEFILNDSPYSTVVKNFATKGARYPLSELANAYDNDLTEQAEPDLKAVLKLVLSIKEVGLLQPITLGVWRKQKYITSGRHRLLALAYIASVDDLELDDTVTSVYVSKVNYNDSVELSTVIIGANDGRRVRPTEKTQMKLAQLGLSGGLDTLTTKPKVVVLKDLVAAETNREYSGTLTPVTVQKLANKVMVEFKTHTVFKVSNEVTDEDKLLLSRFVSYFVDFIGEHEQQWRVDYGNVARSVGLIVTKQHTEFEELLDSLLGVDTVSEEPKLEQTPVVEVSSQSDEDDPEDDEDEATVEYDIVEV